MSTIRDSLLPVVDLMRGLPDTFGLRRFAVTIRRRIYPGEYVGDGVPALEDIVITPPPRVRAHSGAVASQSNLSYMLVNTNLIKDRYYQIDKITPAYVDARTGQPGGYTPFQLRMKVSPDLKNVEPVVILIGDDGYARECIQIEFNQDRAFGYSMLVQETDRTKVSLTSIAITPSPAALTMPAQLQLRAIGTFADGQSYEITPIVRWSSSSSAVATVDLLGVATGVSAGTSQIRAALGDVVAPVATLTVT